MHGFTDWQKLILHTIQVSPKILNEVSLSTKNIVSLLKDEAEDDFNTPLHIHKKEENGSKKEK